uniref:Mitochondrial ribonuclease P catalytic subunit n=1 Tax=Cuerna arida TaxID=1464854 RepID=A0A1B6ES66_9HEMI
MVVYFNVIRIIARNRTQCCLHEKYVFNVPFTSTLVNRNPCLFVSFYTSSLWKDKLKCVDNRQFSSYINSTQIRKLSCEGKEVQNETTIPEIPESFKKLHSKQEQFLRSKLEDEIRKASSLTTEDWNSIIHSVLEMPGTITKENIYAVILNVCSELKSLTLGKSFFNYLRLNKKQINRATYGNYLRLFHVCSDDCTDIDLEEIETTYRELLHLYPLLDSYTAEKAVCALSITKNWREYEELFKNIKLFYSPTQYVYSVVIKTAFKHRDLDLGWSLIEEMYLNGLYVPDEVFIFWLERGDKNKNEVLIKLLDFLKKFNIMPSLSVSKVLKETFENLGGFRKGTFVQISKRGECRNCHAKLDQASVSPEDYNQLKEAFLNPVLIGKDIFQKTKPEEFNEFLTFLEKTAPYDIVLDGLNIALKVPRSRRSPSTFAFQLKAVVQHFACQNAKILILGRKHMKKWPSEDMRYIYNNAHVFLTDDISQDDPFLLYATLYSGLGTCFVSQDMMRGHKFLLADPKLQATFIKWQAKHQFCIEFIDIYGNLGLKEPVSFMQSIQCNSRGDWHIPYTVKEDLPNGVRVDNYHKHWLCLSSQPSQHASSYDKRRQPISHNRSKFVLKSLFDS